MSPGCGFVRGGEVATDGDVPFGERCDEILDHVLPDTLGEFHPEVVMLLCTRRDVEDRKWSDDEGTVDPFDAAYRQRINSDYARISELVTASGATALFVRGPLDDPFWLGKEPMPNYPERRAVVDGVMRATGDGSWCECGSSTCGRGSKPTASPPAMMPRPDGMHWTPEAAFDLTDRWLGPTLLSIARPS